MGSLFLSSKHRINNPIINYNSLDLPNDAQAKI